MSPSLSKEWLQFIDEIINEAGLIAQHYFRNSFAIDSKADATPVTLADREIETLLRNKIQTYLPTHAISGEEFGYTTTPSPWTWVIDPIDGTMAFMSGRATFTILLTLLYEERPVLSVIDQPILKERWIARLGHATLFNDQSVSTRSDKVLSQAILATTSREYFSDAKGKHFDALLSHTGFRIYGGDAYNYGALANGWIDLVVESGLKPHDFLPLIPLIEGAGGKITDWQGKDLSLHSNGDILAAATHELHQAALPFLN